MFKYPGVRSDTDLHTFGFPFNPWQKANPIATGASIKEYLGDTAEKFGIDKHFEFRHKVVGAEWRSEEQQWRLDVDNEGRRKIYYAKFVIMGTGYYDYDKPLQASIPGLENFKGMKVHPQFWPQDLDYKGKKMVIIGSGATAITILPAVVDGGVGSITMLQRTPSYIMSVPQKKPGEKKWYDYFPRWIALRLVRIQFIIATYLLYLLCRAFPTAATKFLYNEAKKMLPKDFVMDPHFKPTYQPWDQRLCLCPDGDFFRAFESGRARIVTDTITRVVEDGIKLTSGEKLEADIIITATGLNLKFCGGIPLIVDKKPVDISEQFLWRSTMLTGVPNLAILIGYVNASWTLGSDSTSRLLTRLMKFMKDNNYTSAAPKILPEEAKDPQLPLPLKSTYINNALHLMPHAGKRGPWRPRKSYIQDIWAAKRADLRDGLEFKSVST